MIKFWDVWVQNKVKKHCKYFDVMQLNYHYSTKTYVYVYFANLIPPTLILNLLITSNNQT